MQDEGKLGVCGAHKHDRLANLYESLSVFSLRFEENIQRTHCKLEVESLVVLTEILENINWLPLKHDFDHFLVSFKYLLAYEFDNRLSSPNSLTQNIAEQSTT